jgi:hypothetical protein
MRIFFWREVPKSAKNGMSQQGVWLVEHILYSDGQLLRNTRKKPKIFLKRV